MVPTDPSRKRTIFLFILLAAISLSAGSASAASTTTTKKVASSSHTATTKKTTSTKTTSGKKTTKTSTKTTKKSKKKKKTGNGARQVKASIIAADRAMVLKDNSDGPVSSLSTVTTTQTPSTSTMTVTNPVTAQTYTITVNNPATIQSYPIPTNDVRGYYAQPVSGSLSQGIHNMNAVDIFAPVGTVVHAAAQGTVIAVSNDDGYGGGYGNYIIITHPNGTETLYAHLSYAIAQVGDVVSQGQPIAYSGRTGKVTGPHLHFEVRGATNPWGTDPLGTIYSI